MIKNKSKIEIQGRWGDQEAKPMDKTLNHDSRDGEAITHLGLKDTLVFHLHKQGPERS